MTMDAHDEFPDGIDPALETLLRRADRGAPPVAFGDLEARILAQAAFPLAARRRSARNSMADTLAAWMRVALPLAAAAAIVAVLGLSRIDRTTLADAELRDSDPGALLSALESDGPNGLAHHVIASDAVSNVPAEIEAP
jgi:anti-sigma-K factor RskA